MNLAGLTDVGSKQRPSVCSTALCPLHSTTDLPFVMERQLQVSSTDAVDGFEGMADDGESPLLALPSGVEIRIVSFLSKGKGGLRDVLTLRAVCRTTRSWVDTLPKSDADGVFSNAQVTIASDPRLLRLFNSSPPPFGVTSLRLNVDKIDQFPQEDEWSSFCTFWNPTLESLELHSRRYPICLNRRVSALMDSDNINTITVTEELEWDPSPLPLPSSLQKVSELRMRTFDCGDLGRAQFFSLLQSNSNLRVFTFEAKIDEDLAAVVQLIDSRKDCSTFQLNLTLPDSLRHTRVFSQLATSILASKSQVRLKLSAFKDWMLLHHEVLPLLSLVEHISTWTPNQQNSSLLDFSNLKELGNVEVREPVTAAQLAFPPSLEKMRISNGFPSWPNLPQAMKDLTCLSYKCGRSEFVYSLRILSHRCLELEQFHVKWELPALPTKSIRTSNFELPPQGFQKLRRLSLKGTFAKDDVKYYRLGIKTTFNWRSIKLTHFNVVFCDSKFRKLPVLDEQMLSDLLEGPSGNSLLQVNIAGECVTPEAIPLLHRLQISAAENVERCLLREGRGAWQRHVDEES